MSEENMAWFHCGRCGSLFQSESGENPDRVCAVCGRDPVIEPVAVEGAGAGGPVGTALPAVRMSTEDLPRHHSRKRTPDQGRGGRRSSKAMPLLIVGWLGFIALIVVGGRWLWREDVAAAGRVGQTQPGNPLRLSQADIAFLEEAVPEAQLVFGGFLSATTPEEWNQFVYGPPAMAGKMRRYFELNPLIQIEPQSLTGNGAALLHLPEGPALDLRWRTSDGRQFESVFRRERGEWRLDWEHYVRYSEYPWGLFLAGSGDPEGEFRLLARQRLADERTGETDMSVVFYAPRFGFPDSATAQSPHFEIDPASPAGVLLMAAFEMEEDGRRPFGSVLPSPDPEGMIRVRVKIRRIEDEKGRRFELEEVIACHWLSLDDPGIPAEEEEAPDQPSAD